MTLPSTAAPPEDLQKFSIDTSPPMPPRRPCRRTYTGPDLPPSTAHLVPTSATPCEPSPTSPALFWAQSLGANESTSVPFSSSSSTEFVWSYSSPGPLEPFAETTYR